MRTKVTIVGAGNVGATCALHVAHKGYADIVLVDVVEGKPQGVALDMLQAGPIVGYDCNIVGTNGYGETADSSVVVITSGIARRPGMSRDDLITTNQGIVASVVENVVRHSPDCIIIVVTNPMDAMAQLAYVTAKFPKNRVVGQGGVLDTARFRTFLAQEAKCSVEDVNAYVLGGHGDEMVPLIESTNIAGVPVERIIPRERLDAIVERTRKGGAEIVALLKSGSAYYAPGAATAQMVDAIVLDRKRILPCATYLDGEYGINGLFVGVPVKLGRNGVEEIIEVQLSEPERAALHRSAASVKELVDVMRI